MNFSISTLAARLTAYDKQEARSIVRLLLYDLFNMSLTDICSGGLEQLNEAEHELLEKCMQRLESGEPIQYVTSKTEFCGRTFHVEPGVLIPRPETEELCQIIIAGYSNTDRHLSILDIGTGSGCIAITLALNLPSSAVTAYDISLTALSIAQQNAINLGAKIVFEKKDILKENDDARHFDIIVSNPPYICKKEATDMKEIVLNHEPHLALFVPDKDPLLFYRAIATYATRTLTRSGKLFFEINPLYAKEMQTMLESLSFTNIFTKQDQFGKTRFVCATKL